MAQINNETLVDVLKPPEFKPYAVKQIKQAILDSEWLGTVNIWVIRGTGNGLEILYQRRPDDSYYARGLFDVSVAGYYEAGEYDSGNHFREFTEELGVNIDKSETYLYGRRLHALINEKTGRERKLCVDIYFSKLNLDLSELNPDPDEVSGLVWLPAKEVFSLFEGRSDQIQAEGIDAVREQASYEIKRDNFPYNFDDYQRKMVKEIINWDKGNLKLQKI